MAAYEVRSTVYFMVEAEDEEGARLHVDNILMEVAYDWTDLEVF